MMALARCSLLGLIGALLVLSMPAAAQDVPAAQDTVAQDTPAAERLAALPPSDDRLAATDLFKIRELSDVTVSPDGRTVAYAVKSIVEKPDSAGQYDYRTHLYLAPAGGRSDPRPLTRGAQSAMSPAWHPGGDWLAFVRAVDGTPQVFALALTGGEAVQLTDAAHGATDPRFAPDGERLLYASALPSKAVRKMSGGGPAWTDERPGRTPISTALGDTTSNDTVQAADPDGSLAAVRAWLDQNQDDQNPRVTTRLDFQGERDLEPAPTYRHLFVLPLRMEPSMESVGDARAITSGFYDHGGGAWMPGSRQVVVSRAPDTGEHPDRVRDRNLYLASADGSGLIPLVQMDGYALTAPAVSPKGTAVAFLASDLRDPGYAQNEIGLFPLDGAGAARLLTLDFDRSASAPQWSPDGWFLYTTAASEGGVPLYRLAPFDRPGARDSLTAADSAATTPPDSAAAPALAAADTARTDPMQATPDSAHAEPVVERLTAITRGIRSFGAGRASLFYVVTEPSNPYELYANTAEMTRERRLSAHNADWLEGKRLSTPKPFTVQRDTLRIQGWTMRPTSPPGGAAPLLVEMHGGPAAMWGPGEATMWHEFQYLAAQGFAIVFSNPRGSGGYGRAFKAANEQDWGTGPMGDVLAAADTAAALPWTDASRQVLTGGSYAGYLTAWIVAHTDRFRAAVAQRGVYDLPTFLGEGNAWRLVPWHFGGYPWEDRAAPAADSLTAPPGDAAALPKPRPAAPSVFDAGRFFQRPDSAAADSAVLVAADTARTDTMVQAMADRSAVTDTSAAAPRFASPREALIQNSPITFVDQIKTPLLIMHADDDLRTGVSQSEMLYRSLKVLRRPVEYVRYPDAGHDLSRTGAPRQRLDRVLRIREFFGRYLDDGSGRSEEAVSARR